MSETVRVTGEIKKVSFSSPEEKEAWAKEIVSPHKTSCHPYNTHLEMLMDDMENYTDKYCRLPGGDVYEVVELLEDNDPDTSRCTIAHTQDTIKFDTTYHNGGTYWQEMVAGEIEKLERN